MLNDVFKRPRHLLQQSVEHMLKQMLKTFKRAFDARARALVTIIVWLAPRAGAGKRSRSNPAL